MLSLPHEAQPSHPLALNLKTTPYFEDQVLRKRPYLRREWCQLALSHPAHRQIRSDGRVRYWVYVTELNKYLRVVTLEAAETVLNALPDRHFRGIKW